MAMLYALTGTFYILGESGTASTTVVEMTERRTWPQGEAAAFKLTNDVLRSRGIEGIGGLVQSRREGNGNYLWRGMSRNVTLLKGSGGIMEIHLQEHGVFRQLVEVHKNHAGMIFSILGVAFGFAMLILILSGAFMMFKLNSFRRSASVVLALGTAMSVSAYLATLYI